MYIIFVGGGPNLTPYIIYQEVYLSSLSMKKIYIYTLSLSLSLSMIHLDRGSKTFVSLCC